MGNVATPRTSHKNEFDVVAEPFAQSEGLLFADVLDAESIEQVFRDQNGKSWKSWEELGSERF